MVLWILAVLTVLWLKVVDCDLFLLCAEWLWKRDIKKFENKVVWITGASQGLGELLAQHLAERGARLILSSRSEEKLRVLKVFLS